MTRRDFSVTLAAAAMPSRVSPERSAVILKAIAGPRLPALLTITTSVPENLRRSFWELRTYTGADTVLESRLAQLFPRVGIRPLLHESASGSLTYLIPFDSLAARDRAWAALNAEPEWTPLQQQFLSYRFGLYRHEPGDRARFGS